MTEHRKDATLREFSGYAMKRAFNAIQTDVNAVLAPFDLRMVTFSALVVIVDNPGLRQSQLADLLSIERPNLVVILDELERRELISRGRAADDRRAYALQVTLAGRRLHDKALAAVRAHEARMTAGLSEAERADLVRMLRRIEQNGGMEHGSGTVSGA
jgi:DNA-binding MarR family transcriptional regulator